MKDNGVPWAQVGLLMLQLQPGSLLLVSVFGLVDGGAQVAAGGAIGTYLDRCAPSTDCKVTCQRYGGVLPIDVP